MGQLFERREKTQLDVDENILQPEQNTVLENDERKVCAFIQNVIFKNGGDLSLLCFSKDSKGYVSANYFYSFIRFKMNNGINYMIVEKNFRKKVSLNCEMCEKEEEGSDYIRVYFRRISELKQLDSLIFQMYKARRKTVQSYFRYNGHLESEARKMLSQMSTLSMSEAEMLIKQIE